MDWFFRSELARLAAQGRLREPDDGVQRRRVEARARDLGVRMVDASSNDYLGLAASPVSRETLITRAGLPVGSGASRLIHGSRAAHLDAERELAAWVGLPSALLFASGYAANVGVIAALGGPGTLLVSDALNHASLIDGCRLSRATLRVVPHLDLDAIDRELGAEAQQRWVVTESYFSMDGDGPDLAALRAVCDRHGAGLVVDEAHALGVFGPRGAGRCAEQGVIPDVLVGTLGKAVGIHGAFVAGSESLRRFLWNRARSFVFSTAPSPVLAELMVLHVKQAQGADEDRMRLQALAARLRNALTHAGLPPRSGSFGPIVPVIMGGNDSVQTAAKRLAEGGILAQGIRPPTVPEGTARLRLTVSARMTDADVDRLASALTSLPSSAAQEARDAGRAPAVAATGVRRIVLLGTGTDVGKTHAGVLVTRRLREAGYSVLSLKPVESGCEGGRAPDAAALASAAGHLPPDGSWKFAEPLSPHLAAQRAGVTLDLTELVAWIRGAAASADPPPSHVLVETAGGVFSPLTEHATNFDLAQALEPAFWILVAHDSLGTLHDTTAALTAMAASGRRPDAVVISAARPTDASSGLNAAELERLGVARATTIARGGQPSLGELIDALAPR